MSTHHHLNPTRRRMLCTGETINAVQRAGLSKTVSLIPAAHSPAQRFLEAILLLEWAEAANRLTAVGIEPRSFVKSTHPLRDGMAITLSEIAHAEPMLRRVLPVVRHRVADSPVIVTTVLSGVPGLRVLPRRDCLELRLLGTGNDIRARLRLLGVDRQSARDMLAGLAGGGNDKPLWANSVLDAAELAGVAQRSLFAAPVLSGIFRRLALFQGADRLTLRVEREMVRLDWVGGPPAHAVADILGWSTCAIPDVVVTAAISGNAHGIAIVSKRTSLPSFFEPWAAWDVLNGVERTRPFGPVPHLAEPLEMFWPWEDPEMRNALAARDVSLVYRFLRRKGVTEREIAAMTHQSVSEVSAIIRGRRVMAYDVLVRIADGFGIPRGYMGLAYDEFSAARIADVRAPAMSPVAELLPVRHAEQTRADLKDALDRMSAGGRR